MKTEKLTVAQFVEDYSGFFEQSLPMTPPEVCRYFTAENLSHMDDEDFEFDNGFFSECVMFIMTEYPELVEL